MKRILYIAWLISLTLLQPLMAGSWNGNVQTWTMGDGSKSSPYQIQSADELAYLAQMVNSGNAYAGTYFRLTADLDLGGQQASDGTWSGQQWKAIGNRNTPFSGHFNGAGHTVDMLYIYTPFDDYLSLFGEIQNASIDSVQLGNSFIFGNDYLGGVCGKAISSTITACTNRAYLSGNMYVGGICGQTVSSTINSCINLASLKNTGYYTGGITGCITTGSVISSCINSGSVLGYIHYVGGICGYAEISSSIDKCINNNTVAGRFYYIGGICGEAFKHDNISNCYYDKQICTVGGINGADLSGSAEGKSTSNLLGSSLSTLLNNGDWSFSSNHYPTPQKLAGTSVSLLSASPLTLTNAETSLYVLSSFQVSTADGISWNSNDNNVVAVTGTNATVYYSSTKNSFATLTASLNGASRTITVSVGDLGTSYRPLTVDNLTDFNNLRLVVNASDTDPIIYKGVTMVNGYAGVYFKLTADIDFGGVQATDGTWSGTSWKPIGTNTYRFKGYFHGQNHILSNFYINDNSTLASQADLGLFGYIDQAIIDSIHIGSGYIKGLDYMGAICGNSSNSKITACSNNSSLSGKDFMGGICGMSNATTISGCANSGSVSGTWQCIGGIAGRTYLSTISNCISTGSVSGSSSTGAISGETQLSSFVSCYYDKQLCPKGGVAGTDIAGGAVGKLTSELKGSGLSATLSTAGNWSLTEAYFPRLKTIATTDAAIVASSPVFFNGTETSQYVKTNFTLGGIDQGVSWTSSDLTAVTISGATATVNYNALALKNVTLTARLNNASKSISLCIGEIGSKANPLTIDSLGDLRKLRDAVNQQNGVTAYKGILMTNGFTGMYFKLTCDIDFLKADTLENWMPIGTNSSIFKGNFNGAGHIVSNLNINRQATAQGLLGVIQDASVDSIHVVGATVKGLNYAAVLCGYVLNSKINACTGTGNVSTTNSAAGLCGYAYNSTVQYCTFSGIVSGNWYVGGICGSAPSTTFAYCLNAGSVSGTGERVGGISGDIASAAKIQYCTNTASVSGTSNCVGGICGYVASSSSITSCVNAGAVTGGGHVIGGISGYTEISSINSSINTGNVSGSYDFGGICGYSNSTVTNCFYDKQLCPVTAVVAHLNGTTITGSAGKLTAEMTGTQLQTTLGTTYWTFGSGLYPKISGTVTNDIATVAAAPLSLSATSSDVYETASTVKSNISTTSDVVWSSNYPTVISLSATSAVVSQQTKDTLVSLTASKNGINKTIIVKVLKSTATGLAELQNAVFSTYPNPATNHVTVRFAQQNQERILIYNLCGAVVKTVEPSNELQTTISLSDIKTGIYLIKVGAQTSRLIVK